MMDAAGKRSAEIAARFVDARRTATPLGAYPGVVPPTLAEGYAVQDAAIAMVDDQVLGWKVGRINAPLDAQHGSNRLAGPIFGRGIVTLESTDDVPEMAVFAGGFGAVEGEYLIRLGSIDPDRRDWTLDEARDAIEAVHVGIEIASSPLGAINVLGPTVTVSDFGNNNGMIVGREIAGWRTSGFEAWTVATEIDGVEVGRGQATSFPDGVIGSVRFLLEGLAARGIAVHPGTWISSGAVSGVHPIAVGQQAIVRFGESDSVRCSIVAAEPQA